MTQGRPTPRYHLANHSPQMARKRGPARRGLFFLHKSRGWVCMGAWAARLWCHCFRLMLQALFPQPQGKKTPKNAHPAHGPAARGR